MIAQWDLGTTGCVSLDQPLLRAFSCGIGIQLESSHSSRQVVSKDTDEESKKSKKNKGKKEAKEKEKTQYGVSRIADSVTEPSNGLVVRFASADVDNPDRYSPKIS